MEVGACGWCARGMGNVPTNFGVSGTYRSRLIGQHLSDTPRYQLRPWRLILKIIVCDMGFNSYCVCLLEVSTSYRHRPSRSEDIAHLLCEQSDWWPWPLTFWPLKRFTSYSWDGFPSCQFWASAPFPSRVRSRHAMTDGQTDTSAHFITPPPSIRGIIA